MRLRNARTYGRTRDRGADEVAELSGELFGGGHVVVGAGGLDTALGLDHPGCVLADAFRVSIAAGWEGGGAGAGAGGDVDVVEPLCH